MTFYNLFINIIQYKSSNKGCSCSFLYSTSLYPPDPPPIYKMESVGAFECTILDWLYFHVKSCRLVDNYKSIPDQTVLNLSVC